MSPAELEYTQGIAGFQVVSSDIEGDEETRIMTLRIERVAFVCKKCGSHNVRVYKQGDRVVKGISAGLSPIHIKFATNKIYCLDCHCCENEDHEFLSHPQARLTKKMEVYIQSLANHMSMNEISMMHDIDWRTVKGIIKSDLSQKYASIPLDNVSIIGVDELYVFRKAKSDQKYVTIVRDLDTGCVLEVSRGKGVKALEAFTERIKPFAHKIRCVCMDMSNSYSSWVSAVLPKAEIVYDHFHIIKAMNECVDNVRRRVTHEIDEQLKNDIKNSRYLLLKNNEDLSNEEKKRLEDARKTSLPLSDAYMMKEKLRRIYSNVKSIDYARRLLRGWCALATATKQTELIKMANRILSHLKGILGFWTFPKMSNAKMEGFNLKVRWLIRQAYGFQDYEFFRLKVFDLPTITITRMV